MTTETRTVADVMSAPVLTATTTERLVDVTTRMHERSVGSVIVVDEERPVGILTERDLIRFSASGTDSRQSTVAEWMTPDPDTVTPDVGVAVAYDNLSSNGYRHFPVVEDGRLVGVVSLRDAWTTAVCHGSCSPRRSPRRG